MKMFAGLDVGGKTTALCIVDEAGKIVWVKRSLGNQVRGLFRPFGVRLPSRAGMKTFAEAAYQAAQADRLLQAGGHCGAA